MSFEQPKVEQPKKPEEEKAPEQEKQAEKSVGISEAKDFDELYRVLEATGGLQGSQKFYDAAELKETIEKIRGGYSRLNQITRAEGLRDKVSELALKEMEQIIKERKE